MARPELRTARLRLVPMSVEHVPLLVELDGDPAVMRFLTGRASTPSVAADY